jgi:hypothetical protein
VAPFRISLLEGPFHLVEVDSDGTIRGDGNVVGSFDGAAVLDVTGRAVATLAGGRVTVTRGSRSEAMRLDGSELVTAGDERVAVSQSGSIERTRPRSRPKRVGTFNGPEEAKRTALVVIVSL